MSAKFDMVLENGNQFQSTTTEIKRLNFEL